MTTEIFLKNIAFTFFFTTGDYLIFFMGGILLIVIFAVLFHYLTKD
jgi:hypothetical protein